VERVSSSFRDSSGYVFELEGTIYRSISNGYKPILAQLVDSGLCKRLVDEKLLLPFEQVDENTIRPMRVPFISYPYEWSFSMLKDAALLTLEVQRLALGYDMILKDASAYNVQFVNGKPILIDHLSFYPYVEGEPWVAYGQFCKHFLAPLALASYKDMSLVKLLQADVDGLKLGVVSRLLPFKARFNFGILTHITLHGVDGKAVPTRPWFKISRLKLLALVENLRSTVKRLDWKPLYGWKDYERECNYSHRATSSKAYLVEEFLRKTNSKVVADLGANVGLYSQVATDLGMQVIAIDSDPACVELCYQSNNGDDCLPLVIDLANPSPAIGWENSERSSFTGRLKVDTILALALVHHLAIGNNLPLERVAGWLINSCCHLIIEFVPKEDEQVQRLLRHREDIFPNYTQKGFEEAFSQYFRLIDCKKIEESKRTLYLMEAR